MTAYILRRLLYAVPIIVGVNLFTFLLFFVSASPDDMARSQINPQGQRRVPLEEIERWKREKNYHLPMLYNDGWYLESVKEVGATGWVDLGAVPAGRRRLILELPDLPAPGGFALSADPPSAVRAQGVSLVAPSKNPPAEPSPLPAGQARRERREFEVTGQGARLGVFLRLPPNVGVVVRVYRHKDLSWGQRFTQTIFFQRSVQFLWFDFGRSDYDDRIIWEEIKRRIPPSLYVTVPIFLMALCLEILFAMGLAYFRGTYLDVWGVAICVALMSISIMFYVIGGQYLASREWRLTPMSGFAYGIDAVKFVLLPILIGVIDSLGAGVRWYRTLFLEEIGKDYVRTARAKGLPEGNVLYRHTLRNSMIPILTGLVVRIPFLFIGSLILETFFSIPGMGSFMVEAIGRQDLASVQAMTVLGSVLYVAGLILTDISYAVVDPRVRLQ